MTLCAGRVELLATVRSGHPSLGQEITIAITIKDNSRWFLCTCGLGLPCEKQDTLLSVKAANQQRVFRVQLDAVDTGAQ
ncbi:hypothetical protein BH18ACI4_BH18ACI4_04730 [soil metagenome]